jgi:hypothetical protein
VPATTVAGSQQGSPVGRYQLQHEKESQRLKKRVGQSGGRHNASRLHSGGRFLANGFEGDVQQKEERMKKMYVVLCLVCLVSSVALAQGKTNVQWKCDKPSDQHSIPVGDKPGDAYAIEQINCTALKGDIAGNKMKSGVGTEFLYLKGDNVTGHGEFVESMENGDKNVYKYEFSGTMKNGAFESGTNKWSLIEGGGKMKGGKANGACKAKANPDQSTSFDCMGTYTPPTT